MYSILERLLSGSLVKSKLITAKDWVGFLNNSSVMKCSWSSRKSTVQNQRDHLLTVNTWANYLTSLNLSFCIYKTREQITESGESSCREITTVYL